MSNEKPRAATFADFAPRDYEFEVHTPMGDVLIIEARDVPADAILDATRGIKRPDVPPKMPIEFQKSADGQPVQVMDPDSPAYLKALEEYGQRLRAAQILTVWKADVPGANRDEKIAALMGLPSWTFSALARVVELLLSISEERIKARPFRPVGTPAGESESAARVD